LSLPFLSALTDDDIMHIVLVALSLALMGISANGFRKRRNVRYFLLMLAFVFFSLGQAVALWQQLYLGDALLSVPVVGLHVTHLLELLMSLSLIGALLQPSRFSRGLTTDEK
jgi:protein-S-isoprenylcysteine O-methyltransferase Ste14